MLKKTVMAGFIVSALAGCSLMDGQTSATADRAEMTKELAKTCAELGSDYTTVSYAVDKASKVMVSIQERQCSVFGDYRTLASKHADVAGFLAINADKSDEELLVAMNEFDADKPANKKIRPQVEAYKNASDAIFDKNVKLAADLALQAAEIAIIASQNATAIAHDTANQGIGNLLTALSNESKEEGEKKEVVPVVAAYHELKARSTLAYDANTLISMDQNTIEQLENLDKVLAEKVKS
ncbi:hypothetical protein JCM19237_5382 [Photobacterium aphoticum]|uniref:Lipoprotein n=1 Tax=Photobacterium aphoticum TaxID=754436 RepID=A0A090QL27_9GAMM|nr:hypothetical protein JCM19237_5382 [Photobacterium aphoticum]